MCTQYKHANPKWNKEHTTQRTFFFFCSQTSYPAVHPSASPQRPQRSTLKSGWSFHLLLLYPEVPAVNLSDSFLLISLVRGFGAKRCETGWCVAHDWQGRSRDLRWSNDPAKKKQKKPHSTHSLQPSLFIFHMAVFLAFVVIKCRWS